MVRMWVYTGHPSFDSLSFYSEEEPRCFKLFMGKEGGVYLPGVGMSNSYIFAHPCERGSRHGRLFNLKVFLFLLYYT